MKTYIEIRSLAKEMLDAPNVTKRRKVGDRLCSLLSDHDVRRRLATEVTPVQPVRGHVSDHVARRNALAEMWRYIVLNACLAIQKPKKKQTKLSAEDVLVPFRLLQICDKADKDFGTGRLRASAMLSRNETKVIVKYCLDMLENEEVLKEAELSMLEMLNYICSRREYVAYFRPNLEMRVIMEEVEKRIGAAADDNSVSHGARDLASKIFESLIRTANEIDVGMQLLLPGCVKLVAVWCTAHTDGLVAFTSMEELAPLFSGVATLLQSDPEQSLAPLTRHGRPILSFAMRCYGNATNLQRIALHEYFFAHLLVAQTAGALQGLMPGDLGDLGMASLKLRQVAALLGLVMADQGKLDEIKYPLAHNHRAQLELIARLVACAQRLHLSRTEWKEMEDPTENLISFVEELTHAGPFQRPRLGKPEEASISVEEVAKSHFFDQVLRRLYQVAPGNDSGLPSKPLPLLEHFAKDQSNTRGDSKVLIPLLQIVGACAETFPSGSCWATDSQRWHKLPPVNIEANEDVLQVSASSPDDLSVVVDIVASVLQLHGGHTGGRETQRWTLLCLMRLTEASAAQSYLSRNTSTEFASLRLAWRRVWSIIFRSDLRYAAYTKAATAGSNGDLVLLLVTGMVRHFCVDPDIRWSNSIPTRQASFLFRRQVDLWKLPIFSGVEMVVVPSLFNLVTTVLFSVGLSNQGKDWIGNVLVSDGKGNTRRHRLLSLCPLSASESGSKDLIGAAMICCAALVHGRVSSVLPAFNTIGFEQFSNQLSIARVARHDPTSFTMLERMCGREARVSGVDCLWMQPLGELVRRYDLVSGEDSFDIVVIERSRLLRSLVSHESSFQSADFLPRSQSDLLFDVIRPLLPTIEVADQATEVIEANDSDTEGLPASILPNSMPLLSSRTLSMKVSIAGRLSCRDDMIVLELQSMSKSISKLFLSVASALLSLCYNEDEFFAVVSDLLLIIRALVEVASRTGVDWPESLVESASSVFESCVRLLEEYEIGGTEEALPVVESRRVARVEEDDNLFADDFDVVDDFQAERQNNVEWGAVEDQVGRKRRRVDQQQPKRSQVRVSEITKGCPNSCCAFLVASVLLALKPSLSVCELVANTLLGVGELDDGSDGLDQEVDLLGALNASLMICTESLMLHGTALRRISDSQPQKSSLVPLLCRLIEAIRYTASPESGLHSYGFGLCVEIVRLAEGRYRDNLLSSDEAKAIVDLLKGSERNRDRRSLSLRPRLRAEQLRAAVLAFQSGKEHFHGQIDRDFPRMFALPSLGDLSSMVRRQASLAVAAALRVLPEDKVVESVRRRLPPIARSQAEFKARKTYKEWYASRILGSGDGAPTVENQMWEDSFTSIECGVIDCWVRIAGTVSTNGANRKMIFDLVQLSLGRHDLVALIFRAIDRIADLRGTTIEHLMEYESEHIVQKWIESGESLFDLPLLVTAPKAISLILKTGNYYTMTQEGASSLSLDMARLRETAATEYIASHCRLILPRFLALSVSRLLDSSVTRDGRRTLFEDPYTKEICSAFQARYDDDVVKKVLRTFTHDIVTFCAPMRCGSQVDQDVAAQVLKLLEGILSKEVVQRQISQHSNLAVRGVLELSGKYARDQRTFRESIERFSEATKALAVQLGRGDPESHGLFACVGGSTTEYMISGKLWLEKGLLESQLSQRWFPIQIVCRMVASELRQDPTTDLQVAFCVNTLCGILLNPALQIVHVQCLEALTELLEAIVSKCPSSNTVRKDVASFASELLATCMHVHERGQQLLVKNCTDARWYRDRALKRSLGILGMRKSDLSTTDAWGWDRNTSDVTFRDDRASLESALAEFHSLADKHTLDAITGSFKVLNFLLQNATSIGLHPDDCVGASPPYEVDSFHYDVLFQLNPELSAQKLVLEWLEGSQSSSNLVTSVPAIVRRLRLKDDAENTMNGAASALEPRGPMCKPDEGDSGIFSIDQRLLRAELVQLQCFLKQLRSEPEQDTGSRLQVNESGKLVRVILGYCGMEYSEQVRLAASTCLGEIDLAAIHSLPTSEYIEEPPKDWIDTAIASKHLLRSLQAQSIERLVSCLKSPQVNVAMVALETLKSLLVTHEGAQCLDILKHRSTTSTLGHFISEGRPKKANSQLCLSEKEIHELKIDAHVSSTSEDWCWNKQLWCRIHDEGTSFDNWICVLVPALLVCCYGDVESSAPGQNSSSEFFSTCQRMSNLEPSFAVAVFPAIILELLATRSDEDRVPGAQGVLSDTWVGSGKTPFNINLSKCFTSLLEGYTTDTREGGRKHSRDTRPIDLIVDTLDTLRRFTQHRFLQSSDHKKNPSSLDEAMSDEAQKTGTGSVSQGRSSKPQRSHSSFDDLGDAPPWRGLTFGVVLHLDGLLVTQACIKARRFAAALFYAELYADARFGRSTGLVSSLSDVEKRGVAASCSPLTSDVSGFDIALSSIAGLVGRKVAVETLHHDALNFMNLLRNCFVDLGEEEARRAVDEQASDLRFACNTVSTGSGSLAGELSPSLYDLQLIDNIAGLERRSASSRLATVECLERLGLRNTLQTYIGGLNMESGSVFRDDDTASLREKWFECRLYDMQWDDSLLHEQASDESDASNRLLKRSMIGLGSPLEGVWNDTNATEGFHEWTVKAMLSLTRDDTALCSIHLTAARGQLLNRMSTLATGEMSPAGTLDVIDRLQVLNDLDGLFSKSESLQGVLARWTQRDTTLNESQQGTIALFENTDKAPSSSHDFSQWVREITLRCLCLTHSKRGNQDDPRVFEHLATHIWRICSANYDSGRYNVAEAALQRLYRLLRFSGGIQGERPDSLTLFRLRLQEAILLESKGNFTGAIRLLKQTLKRIPDEKASAERESLMADALVTCGRLMTKHKVEPANTILDNYLKKGSNVALAAYMKNMTTTTARSATNAFLAMGQVASNIFETVAARVKSLEWQQAGKGILDRKKELGECHKLIKELEDRLQSSRKRKKQSKETYELERELLEAKIYQTQLAREITNASTERKQIQSSVVTYRSLALQAFVSALSIADSRGPADMSRHVYRMVSLWLSGEIVQSEGGKVATTTIEAVDTTMTKAMETIPSFRFVPLSSQLFSRLGFDDANHSNRVSQELLQRLVFKMCLDHPYHCLVHLITLSNGQKVGTGVGGRQANVFLENTGGTKVEKAKEILEALKNKDLLFICRLIESMESLADAYIHLAMVDTKSFPRAKKTILFSQVCVSKKQPRLDQCLGSGARKPPCAPCILTSPPPLRPGCDYGGGREDPPGAERIVGFESCFSITDGGLHRPKIVVCLGSKGGRFKQLVKGEDEIRQDAVMEQVFGYVNELMTRHTFGQRDSPKSEGSSGQILASTKSTLKLVTYNIIPLSPASGVLEWVENTIPFGEYMIDKGSRKSADHIGAHSKYYPGEWGSQLCREYYRSQAQGARRKAFDTICEHHSPVFRYFFVERFGNSLEAWHSAKMRYTRSVAVNSVVGHILGIGDRHTSNILVHETTGEVVHIDFGIVFEQGKLLNTPEKVPFRLTQNIIDGMGPTGIEGTFTKAAEETLTVLKRNSNALLTILSAIVSDPLYRWSVSPVKARQRQRLSEKDEEDSGGRLQERRKSVEADDSKSGKDESKPGTETNEAAAHAITRISEKLQGYEDGTSGEQQSVEGQVQLLVNSAKDQDNLSEMYFGWAPWM